MVWAILCYNMAKKFSRSKFYVDGHLTNINFNFRRGWVYALSPHPQIGTPTCKSSRKFSHGKCSIPYNPFPTQMHNAPDMYIYNSHAHIFASSPGSPVFLNILRSWEWAWGQGYTFLYTVYIHPHTHTHIYPHPSYSLCVFVVQVHWVEELYAYGNRISQLPHEVCNLKKLRKLALNENLLATLPGETVQYSALEDVVWCIFIVGTHLPLCYYL